MEQPLVSVLMTAYNREKYIAEAIESVLASTYTNFELIITDDASSDSTAAIAKSYAQKDSRVKVYVNEKNLTDYHNRNKAASYAVGKYLKYLDSDDIIYPHSLWLMVHQMEQYPAAGYAFSASHVHVHNIALRYPVLFSPEQGFREHFLNRGFFYSGPGGVIFRTAVFNQFNGFSGRRFLGDMELLMKIALQYPTLMIQPTLIWWRVHDEQEQNFEFRNPAIVADRYNMAIEFLQQSALSSQEKKKAKESMDKMLARQFFRLVFRGDRKNAFKIKQQAGFTNLDLLKALNIKNKLRSFIK